MTAPSCRTRNRSLTRFLPVVAAIAIIACASDTRRDANTSARIAAMRQSAGAWDLTFSTDDATGSLARGAVAFLPKADDSASSMRGALRLDLRTLSLPLVEDNVSISATIHSGAKNSPDSLIVVSERLSSGLSLRLAVAMGKESAAGEWRTDSYSVAGRGRLTMTRHR